MPKIGELQVSQDVADLYYEAHPDEAETNKVASQPASKYHNVRAEFRGMRFQSGHEVEVVSKLMMLEDRRQGVFGLRLQVRFPLPNDEVYVSDGTYLDEHIQGHVFDAKGMRTRDYLRKKKLFKATYGKEIEEL